MTVAINGISIGQPPMSARGMDPEAYAQQYASEKGLKISEARAELQAQHGAPQGAGGTAVSDAISSGNVDGSGRQPALPPEAMTLHYSYGIPIEVIQEGDDAIQQFAQENNIDLPEKTKGGSINYSC